MKIFKIIMLFLSIVIQLVLMYFVYETYITAKDVISVSGLSLVVAMFTVAPLFITLWLITAGLTISNLIRSFTNIKYLWWLTVIELISVVFHIFVLLDLVSSLKG